MNFALFMGSFCQLMERMDHFVGTEIFRWPCNPIVCPEKSSWKSHPSWYFLTDGRVIPRAEKVIDVVLLTNLSTHLAGLLVKNHCAAPAHPPRLMKSLLGFGQTRPVVYQASTSRVGFLGFFSYEMKTVSPSSLRN